MIRKPEVTVLMTVNNGGKHIEEAINSVLRQSFTDFELLIMDNGSIDNIVEIVQKYTDYRMQLEHCNSDSIKNLNKGLMLAKGNYIAYMDADDIMHSERLRIQLKRMKRHPEITVCGTWVKLFGEDSNMTFSPHLGNGIIKNPILELLKSNILFYPTVMVAKSFLTENSIAYSDYPCMADYKLWFDIAKCGGALFIEPQELLFHRLFGDHIVTKKKDDIRIQSTLLRKEMLKHLLSLCYNKTLDDLFHNMEELEAEKKMETEDIFHFFFLILSRHFIERP